MLFFVVILLSVIGSLSMNSNTTVGGKEDQLNAIDLELSGKCYNNIFLAEWWSYVWCHRTGVRQVHYNHQSQRVEIENVLGDFVAEESNADHQIFRSNVAECLNEGTGVLHRRYSEVSIECCEENGRHVAHKDAADEAGGVVIASVEEPVPCSYYIVVCAQVACGRGTLEEIERKRIAAHAAILKEEQKRNLKKVHKMRQRTAHLEHQRALRQGRVMHSGLDQFVATLDGLSETELDNLEDVKDLKQSEESAMRSSTGSSPSQTGAEEAMLFDWHSSSPYRKKTPEYDMPTEKDQVRLKERVKEMFVHAYDAYMANGFPEAELRPLTCMGGAFESVKIPLVTLIDTLDTLVVMGNYTEFRKAVNIVQNHYENFDLDVNVSVFETTIRVLGGLLSAHLMAIDPMLGIYDESSANTDGSKPESYNDSLLHLSIDLGNRLLPAFKTNTGIPYGTVNLRNGVPRGETEIASTAGAGSLIVEFEVLSSLSQDKRYGDAAYGALGALFNRRSSIDLLGKHIHTDTGAWFESVSGIGSNSDSFYEYLLKAYLLFRRKELYTMFTTTYSAIKRFVQNGDWFSDVDMYNGKLRRHRTENLHAFWPGMEATLGFTESGARTLNALYSVWSDLGFLPEEIDNVQWLQGKAVMHGYYPLRPELIESTYHQYRTTRDRSWLVAGEIFLDSLETRTPTACGFASVSNLETMDLKDEMPSFFLSETLKYLYLLFDEENFVHDRSYIFSTEAHLFDPNQLLYVPRNETSLNSTTVRNDLIFKDSLYNNDGDLLENGKTDLASDTLPSLPSTCMKKLWWSEVDAWVLNSITPHPLQDPAKMESAKNAGKHKSKNYDSSEKPTRMSALLQSESKKRLQRERVKQIRAGKRLEFGAGGDANVEVAEDPETAFDKLSGVKGWAFNSAGPLSALLASLSKMTGVNKDSDKEKDDATAPVYSSLDFTAAIEAASDVKQFRSMTRIANSMHNSARMSMLLKQRTESVRPSSSAEKRASNRLKRRQNTCYPEDEPVMKGHKDALQTVEVSMGNLGDFTVHVYTDGFVVRSKHFGNTLEISNVGQPIMFVREFNDITSTTALGDIMGDVIRCSVSIEINGESTWERSCTIASFGPSNLDLPIKANIQKGYYSKIPEEDNASRDHFKDIDPLCAAPSSDDGIPAPSKNDGVGWFGKLFPQGSQSDTDDVATNPMSVAGRIALVRRGECMFEEKAESAHQLGASAVIVVNNEDGLFVMSGKGNEPRPLSDDKGSADSEKPNQTLPGYDRYGTMPTVMLVEKDGIDLIKILAEHAENTNEHAKVQVNIARTPMMLDSRWLGSTDYPKIRMKSNIVHVASSENWGAILSSSTGHEWQLFIMSTNEMPAVNVWPSTLMSPSGQQVTSTAAFSLNPIEIYKRTLNRQCPAFIDRGNYGNRNGEAIESCKGKDCLENAAPVTMRFNRKGNY